MLGKRGQIRQIRNSEDDFIGDRFIDSDGLPLPIEFENHAAVPGSVPGLVYVSGPFGPPPIDFQEPVAGPDAQPVSQAAGIQIEELDALQIASELRLGLPDPPRHLQARLGKGFVIERLLRSVRADAYVMVDGDDTYPAERVGDLLGPVLRGEADMVVGCRLAGHGDGSFRPLHLAGNRLVRGLINRIFRTRLSPIPGSLERYPARTRLHHRL